jgi:hypothetical protein
MAATFVVCLRCGKVHETTAADHLPKDWQRSHGDLYCSHCADTSVLEAGTASDILDEEVIYPSRDSVEDEGYCEVCNGPCQGH